MNKCIQVSLAIRGGYVPGKFSTANTKTPVLSILLNMAVFPRYSRFLSPRIVKTTNTKPANSEGRLYSQKMVIGEVAIFLDGPDVERLSLVTKYNTHPISC